MTLRCTCGPTIHVALRRWLDHPSRTDVCVENRTRDGGGARARYRRYFNGGRGERERAHLLDVSACENWARMCVRAREEVFYYTFLIGGACDRSVRCIVDIYSHLSVVRL